MARYIIYSAERGVLVGAASGHTFFSKADAVGQYAVPTFRGEEDIAKIFDYWRTRGDQGKYVVFRVGTDAHYADAFELATAGVPMDALEQLVQNTPTFGSA